MEMMKRLVLGALLAVASTVFAEGSGEVLWWKISDFSNIKAENSDLTAGELGVNAARIRYEGNDVVAYLPIYAVDGNGGSWPSVGDGSAALLPGGFFSSLGNTSSSSYKFILELGNWTKDRGWTSTSMESAPAYYDYLKTEQHIAEWIDTVPNYATPWTPTSFTVVPEPSSGVLLLAASAMLALRRRKTRAHG